MNKQDLLQKLIAEGYSDTIVNAFGEVDRSRFVLPQYSAYSYADRALPIGYDQTISQPSTIAFMLDLLELESEHKILEVGSGSGYVLALLGEIVKKGKVYGVERIYDLVIKSRKKLFKYRNIAIEHASKSLGMPEKAPFDRILVSASAIEVPHELMSQLATGGIMVIPIGNSILRIRKKEDGIISEDYPGFVFVKLYL